MNSLYGNSLKSSVLDYYYQNPIEFMRLVSDRAEPHIVEGILEDISNLPEQCLTSFELHLKKILLEAIERIKDKPANIQELAAEDYRNFYIHENF